MSLLTFVNNLSNNFNFYSLIYIAVFRQSTKKHVVLIGLELFISRSVEHGLDHILAYTNISIYISIYAFIYINKYICTYKSTHMS